VPWEWIQNETVPWGSQYTIDLRPGSSTEVVGVAGYVFEKKPGHSQDNGQNWEIADDETGYYWRVAYHLFDTSVVYAGDKRSLDAGQSYQPLPVPSELNDDGLQVMDYCRAQPDIVYMASRDTRRILRSVDRGDTWELYAEPGWTVAPFDPKITFAVNPVHCNVIYTVDQDGDLARFDGAGWESLGVLNNVETPQGYFNYIRSVMVDPNHPEIIYAGIFGTGISSIFRSTDDGATWQDISYNRFRDEVGGINISPISGEVMVSGCSGTWVLPPPYPTNHGIYENLIPRPSCYDGLQNGDEQGIDCGGSCPDNCGDVDGGQPDGDGDDGDDDGDDGDGDDGDGGRPDAGADADLPDGADSAGDGGQTDGADSSGADNVGSRVEGDCGCGQRAALLPTPLLFLLLLTFPGLLRRRHERHGT